MIIIGHRGARNEAPENTVEGFVHAQENGCLHFELDVQLSSDHHLVVYHDKSLKRTCGIRRQVNHTPYATLKKSDTRLNTPGWPTPCYIPLLQDVINAVPKTESWQLEVKPDSRHSMRILMIKLSSFLEANELHQKAVVTSSNRWFLKNIKQISTTIRTGYVAEFRFRDSIKIARKLGCSLLVLNEKLINERLLERSKKESFEISCWTVNNLERMEALKRSQIHSTITDIPTSAIKHFSTN